MAGQSHEKPPKHAVSAVDANAILLRLAGKQPQKKGDASSEQKDKKKGKSKDKKQSTVNQVIDTKNEKKHSKEPGSFVHGKRHSIDADTVMKKDMDSELDGEPMPDMLCTDELDEATLMSFRELFNTLDQSNTGIITAENMYEELRRVDSEITFSDVEEVLRKVDQDGSGTIDFDEFLYHMTAMGGDLFGGDDEGEVDEEQRKKHSRRKRLFYSAITRFSIKQTLADIEKTFRKQAPHVISHYTAGVRLIGLTTRQLEREMKKMQKSAGKDDSPYAKPLNFVHLGMKGQKKIVQRKKIQTIKEKVCSTRDLQQVEPEEDPAVNNLTKEIQDTMMMFANKKGNIGSEDANIIMKLRKKLGSVTARMKDKQNTEVDASTSRLSTMPSLNKPRSAVLRTVDDPNPSLKPKPKSAPVKPGKQEKKNNLLKGMGWTTPRIQYIDVPLPSLRMKHKSEKPTFNDLHRIRAKVNQAIDVYYHNLRQAEIRNAWEHWDRLYADVILPKKLLSNFRTVYASYSPHREEEAFVVCPWKPGPFRYIRHMNTTNLSFSKSPDVAIIVNNRQRGNSAMAQPRSKSCQQTVAPTFRQTPSPIARPCSSLADHCLDTHP